MFWLTYLFCAMVLIADMAAGSALVAAMASALAIVRLALVAAAVLVVDLADVVELGVRHLVGHFRL